ncbi:MAG: arylesterase [Alphaproteobacteria bacterium]
MTSRLKIWVASLAITLIAVLHPANDAKAAPNDLVITVIGDSLSAGFKVDKKDALPAQLGEVLKEWGIYAKMVNAGVSGDTTTGGLARFDWSVPAETDLLIIALGANDGFRNVPPYTVKHNLEQMILKAKARNMKVVLAGMKALQNYGTSYELAFNRIYGDLSLKHGVPLYPFLLKDVLRVPSLNLPDGLHPNPRGIRIMAENLVPVVVDALR